MEFQESDAQGELVCVEYDDRNLYSSASVENGTSSHSDWPLKSATERSPRIVRAWFKLQYTQCPTEWYQRYSRHKNKTGYKFAQRNKNILTTRAIGDTDSVLMVSHQS